MNELTKEEIVNMFEALLEKFEDKKGKYLFLYLSVYKYYAVYKSTGQVRFDLEKNYQHFVVENSE